MAPYTPVLIEFTKSRGGRPWNVIATDGRGCLCGFDIERSKRAGGLWAHMSSVGHHDGLSLEHSGASRYWVAPGYEIKNDRHKRKRRMARPPEGRFSPGKLFNTCMDADRCEGGEYCCECDDFVPEGNKHNKGCPNA